MNLIKTLSLSLRTICAFAFLLSTLGLNAQTAYVASNGANELTAVDLNSQSVVANISLLSAPVKVAVSPDGSQVVVVSRSQITFVDPANNSILIETTIPNGTEVKDVVYNTDGTVVFTIDQATTLIVPFNTSDFNAGQFGFLLSGVAPIAGAVDPNTGNLLVANNGSGDVATLTTSPVITQTGANVAAGASPQEIIFLPGTSTAYVTNFNGNSVSVIEGGASTTIGGNGDQANLISNPVGLVSNADGTEVYVVENGTNQVAVIDVATASVVRRYSAGTDPRGIDITADDATLVVTNFGDNTISVIDVATGDVINLTGVNGPLSVGIAESLIMNEAPVASFTADVTSGDAPLTVNFDASASSDADGTITDYAWDFGDGNTAGGVTATNTFGGGSFTVTLTVTDDMGETASTTQVITVTDPLEGELEGIINDQTVTVNEFGLNFGGVTASVVTPFDQYDVFNGNATAAIPFDETFRVGASDFTQTLIATLTIAFQENGLLTLDQTIGDFLNLNNANIPADRTIDQLLSHTSGIADFAANANYSSTILFDVTRNWTANDLLTEFVTDAPADAGTFAYSNTNFLLLGLILEEANGNDNLQASFDNFIGTPAGLTGIEFYGSSDPSDLAPVFADVSGFGFPNQLTPNTSVYTGASTAGNILGTPNQFIQFHNQLAQGNILSADGVASLLDYSEITGRLSNQYGRGVENFTLDIDGVNLDFFGHIGNINNVSVSLYSADAQTGVFLSTNLNLATEEDVLELARQLLDAAIDGTQFRTNEAPVAAFSATPESGDAPLTVDFDATASTDDVAVDTYSWDFGDGNTGEGVTTSNTYADAGDYTVTLIVTDAEGLADTTTATITVTIPNAAPVAAFTATPETGDAPLTVDVDASDSTDDAGIDTYAWDFGDGNTATGETASNTYADAGEFTITLIVTDAEGLADTATATITVTVPNAAPVAAFTATPETGDAPLTVDVDASGSTDDAGIDSYAWDFGDGNTATGETASNTYAAAGEFTITLVVTDAEGLADTATVTITVTEPVDPVIRLLAVDTENETVTIRNFSAVEEDISDYQLCLGPGQYNILSNYTNITGDLVLSADEEVVIDLTSGTLNVQALPDSDGALGLFSNTNFSSTSPDDIEDYIQWGAADGNRISQAVAAGRWDAVESFVAGNSPYNYIGGANDVGASFWEATAPETFTLQILHASDLEGGVDALENAPNFAAIVDALEDEFDNTVRLSGGDNYIPGPFFGAAGNRALRSVLQDVYQDLFNEPGLTNIREGEGRVDISIMNIIDFDASAVGNHEFDAGTDAFASLIGTDIRGAGLGDTRWLGAQFPYLSANLDFSTESDFDGLATTDILPNTAFESLPSDLTAAGAAPKLAPATTIAVGEETIGVIGATTQLVQQITSSGGVSIVGPTVNDMPALAAVLQPIVDGFEADGINKIILVTHLQQIVLEKELATLMSGVDVIVAGGSDVLQAQTDDVLRAGDTAEEGYPFSTTNADGNPIVVVGTEGEYSYVGRLVIEFDENGVLVDGSQDNPINGAYATIPSIVDEVAGEDAFAENSKGELVSRLTNALNDVIEATDGNILGQTSVYLDGRRSQVRTQETNLGNLTADANLVAAQAIDSTVEVSLKNGGGIRNPIGRVIDNGDGTSTFAPTEANPDAGKEEGDISQLDVQNSLRFNNGLTLLTLTIEEFLGVLEHSVAASGPGNTPGQFPQVGGVAFNFDVNEPAGSRISDVAIIDADGVVTELLVVCGQVVADADRTIRIVTLNFLADGGDGYPYPDLSSPDRVDLFADTTLAEGASNFAGAGTEQDALAEYLLANFNAPNAPFGIAETDVVDDLRIVQAPKPVAVATADTTSGVAPLTVTFDGSASSVEGGAIEVYVWDFGDGSDFGEGATVEHVYEAAGTYLVTLTAVSDRGVAACTTIEVVVTEPEPETFTLQILHASDLEGGVAALENAPNFAAIVDALEDEFDNTVRLSGGDNYIPGPFFNAAGNRSLRDVLQDVYQDLFNEPGLTNIREGDGRVDISIMNIIDFDASAVGNHEFDAGTDAFGGLIGTDIRGEGLGDTRWLGAQFPYLSANLDFSTDGNLSGLATTDILPNTAFESLPSDLTAAAAAPKLAPATTIAVGEETIGVIGATTQLVQQITSSEGVSVVGPTVNDMAALAGVLQPIVDGFEADGINKIILVTHLQQIALEKELATLMSGVDVVVAGGSDVLQAQSDDVLRSGDTPEEGYPFTTADVDGNTTLVVGTDGEYSYVGRLVIEFDENGNIVAGSQDNPINGAYATIPTIVDEVAGDSAFAENSKGELVSRLTNALQSVIDETAGNVLGQTAVYLDGRRSQVRTQETNLGNLTADANLVAAQAADETVEVSLKNGGGIRAAIGGVSNGELVPPVDNNITQLDVENSLRFNNGLTLLTLTAQEFCDVLEHAVAASGEGNTPGQFPQVSGVSFNFDVDQEAGSRISDISIVDLDGNVVEAIKVCGEIVDPARTIRIVTLNFLADGGDGYPYPDLSSPDRVDLFADTTLAEGASNFAGAGTEQDALAEYLLANFNAPNAPFDVAETDVDSDNRIVQAAAPVAAFSAEPTSGDAPLGVAFDASASTGSIAEYNWDFGDGNTGTGVEAGNTYEAAGTYTVTLTVVSDRGVANCTSTEIVVGDPQAETFTLQILHASDLEGGVDALENAPNFAAIVDALEDEFDNTVRLSGGDNYIPGPFFNAAGNRDLRSVLQDVYQDLFNEPGLTNIREGDGRVDISIMNIIDFDASAVGNHEFDAGTDAFGGLIGTDIRGEGLGDTRWLGAQFPYLSANLDFSTDGDLSGLATTDILPNTAFESLPSDLTAAGAAPKLAPATTIAVGEETIGVIGATTQLVQQITSSGDVSVVGPTENDMAALAGVLQPIVDGFEADGINKIILVTHLQQIALEKELATLMSGVDVIVAGGSDVLQAQSDDVLRSGDTPEEGYPFTTAGADGNTTLVVGTDGEYSYVGRLVIEFNEDGTIVDGSQDNAINGAYATIPTIVDEVAGADAFAENSKGELVSRLTNALQGIIDETAGNVLGQSSVYLDGRRSQVRTQETNLGNLTADANLAAAQEFDATVEVSLKNGGGIRAAIGQVVDNGDGTSTFAPPADSNITQLDVENSLRFNNGLTLLTLTAQEFNDVIEHAVAASGPGNTPGQFPQVSGVKFVYDVNQEAGSRVSDISIVDADGNVIEDIKVCGELVTDRTIRIVTLNFLADGGDGYPYPDLANPDRVDLFDTLTAPGLSAFAGPGTEQDALAEYLRANFNAPLNTPFADAETSMDEDNRIVQATQPVALFIVDTETGDAPLTVNFDGSSSTGDVVDYAWDFGDGNTGSGASASNTYAEAGEYTATLTVTNARGARDCASITITVTAPQVAPVAAFTATPETGEAPLSVAFDASGSSDEDGTIEFYDWDFGNGSTGSGVTTSVDYATAGTYTVTLTVTDNDGLTSTSTLDIVVTDPVNSAPTAAFTASTFRGVAPLEVTFDASASNDSDGSIVDYAYDFGDGNTASGNTSEFITNTVNVFSDPGTYTVTLTVTDNDGATGTISQVFVVEEGGTGGQLTSVLEAEDLTNVQGLNFGGVSAAVITQDGELFTVTDGQATPAIEMADTNTLGISDVTQTVLATLTLGLMEEGALMLSQTVSDFVDVAGLTNVPGDITISQLLSHTSGLANFGTATNYDADVLFDVERVWTAEEILSSFVGEAGPTGEFAYANTNFLVLGLVLDAANGDETLQQSLERVVLDPAGVSGVEFYGIEDPTTLAPLFADVSGFGFPQQLTPNTSVFTGASTAGNIYGTPTSFVTLIDQIVKGEVISSENVGRLVDFSSITGRLSNGYSLGVENFTLDIDGNDVDFIGHIGNLNYVSVLLYSPLANTGVHLVTNNALVSEEAALEAARKLLDVVLDGDEVSADPPVATCRRLVNLNLSADGMATLSIDDVNVGSTPLDATLSLDNTEFDCSDVSRYNTSTLTVTDNQGRSASCTAIVRVTDNQDLPAIYTTDNIGQSTGSSSFIGCAGAITVESRKTGSPFAGTQDWNQFTSTPITGDFTLKVRVSRVTTSGVAGVMVRESYDPNAEMVYAGTATDVSGAIEIGFRDRSSQVDPEVTNVAGGGDMYTIERRGSTVRIFNGTRPLLTKRFDERTILVGFFATARKSWIVSGRFSEIEITDHSALMQQPDLTTDAVKLYNEANFFDAEVFPNPTKDVLNIRFSMTTEEEVNIEIFDLLGRNIFRQEINGVLAGESFRIEMPANEMKAGTYMIMVKANGINPVFKQFVKQ